MLKINFLSLLFRFRSLPAGVYSLFRLLHGRRMLNNGGRVIGSYFAIGFTLYVQRHFTGF